MTCQPMEKIDDGIHADGEVVPMPEADMGFFHIANLLPKMYIASATHPVTAGAG